jgi:hypothetical protein
MMLASGFVIIFVPREVIGRIWYFMFFPLLALCGFLYVRLMFQVGDKEVTKVLNSKPVFSFPCGRASSVDRQIAEKGRLAVNDDKIYFITKRNGKLVIAFEEKIKDLDGFSVGTFKDEQTGFFFHKGKEEFGFSCRQVDKVRDRLVQALGWEDEVPFHGDVSVGDDAATAPVFGDDDIDN